jgi:sorting nexin-29
MIARSGEILHDKLFELVQAIWRTENMPQDWYTAMLIPIYKKGNRLVCANYRGIALLCTAYKIFTYILLDKINPYAKHLLGKYQCGFRQGRGTTDALFSVRMILEKCREFDVPVYQLVIEFKQTYDSLNQERLWTALVSMGIPGKLVALCRMSIQNTQCCVRVENEISKIFKVDSGVRQDDAISPMFFNLTWEYEFRQKKLPVNNNILSTCIARIIAGNRTLFSWKPFFGSPYL